LADSRKLVVTTLRPEELVVETIAAHARERVLIDGLSEEQVRGASALPGWTRGHVLGSRLAFIRAVNRQLDYAQSDRLVEFIDGGREGRDAWIEAHIDRPAGELVREVQERLTALDARWSQLGPSDWTRRIIYRGPGVLTDLLQACWRESEIHCVDLDLGVQPSAWSAEFCAQLFEFLEQRVPDGVQLELMADEGSVWSLGSGEVVQVRGTLTDLAAWLSGREPVGSLESSTGSLPELGRLRPARKEER
jgi:maleylpyruvate isomerase